MSNSLSALGGPPPEVRAADAEQPVADAFYAWAPSELARRRHAADQARARARAASDEVRWQVAERALARHQQLADMLAHQDPYFARIRCTVMDDGDTPVPLDVRVSNYARSESFPVPSGSGEMLDVSHLAALADLVRHPQQSALAISLSERQLLQAGGTGELEVRGTAVEDVEWDGRQIVRVAPRFGAVFEDRVKRRLAAGPSTSLEAMADVLDAEQSRILAHRDPRRRVLLLDGPAGTGKTVVAAHRIAVAAPPDRPGLYVVPSPTLAAYVRPVLPRLGLARGTDVATPQSLLARLAPELVPWVVAEPESPWPADGVRQILAAPRNSAARFLEGVADAFRHPAALLLLAVHMGRRLSPAPAWVIVDEVQSLPEPGLGALGRLAAPDAWWVLAGDALQAELDGFAFRGAARQLGPGHGVPQRVRLRQAYRIPPVIHAAGEAIRRRLDPEGPASDSVRWHAVPGAVGRWEADPADPAAAIRRWLEAARAAAPSGTMAVILPDGWRGAQVDAAHRLLAEVGAAPERLAPDPVYRGGLVLAPLALLRGLEFDAVLIWDASARTYPGTPAAGRRVYTAVTRARRLAAALTATDPSPWVADWPVHRAPMG